MAGNVNIELDNRKKGLVIAACIIMYFNYMVINLGTDLLYHGLDPRIRLGGEK